MDGNRDSVRERGKYEEVWGHEAYRAYAPGEHLVERYLGECRPEKGRLIDFGAGTGRAALELQERGFDVTMIDIAGNCLDEEVERKMPGRLVVANLWESLDLPRADEGFCVDVMEHIPTEKVRDVVRNCLRLCSRVFFHICLREDHFGKLVDEPLHLTVKPFAWWKRLLEVNGRVIDARDLIENGWFYVARG